MIKKGKLKTSSLTKGNVFNAINASYIINGKAPNNE
tara:strand:- start:58 stop:165 length:108 start_codon:yes stop_codon:yes gene_type:complete